jgi:DNA-binding transcriptional MerR regulator
MGAVMDEFQSADQEKITGVKRNRLQVWIERGWIKPSQRATGYGSRNVFSRDDLYNIAIFKAIVEKGWSRSVAAEFIEKGRVRVESGTRGELDKQSGVVRWGAIPSMRSRDGATLLPPCAGYGVFVRIKGKVLHTFVAGPLDKVGAELESIAKEKDVDDIYILNLKTILSQVDAKIKEVKR